MDPRLVEEKWQEIRRCIYEFLPETEELIRAMKAAGAPIHCEEVGVSEEFMADAMRYHDYMRYRLNLTRLLPMLNIDPMNYID